MLIAEALVETDRSSRYLVQLCEHFDRKAQAFPRVDYKARHIPVSMCMSSGRTAKE